MVNVAESALNYRPIAKDDLMYLRLVKLNDRTVYNLERTNENPAQPNSACESIWYHTFETDRESLAVAKVLKSFLEEPTFNTLRTQEQLGYIVRASLGSNFRLMHFSILVQSSVKDAHFLEHRMNEFLAKMLETWDPTEEEVETIKAAQINMLRQKRTSLGAEASFNWGCLTIDETGFDSDLQKIAAIERVTKDQVMACFKHVFFENPRRVVLKIHSHAHLADQEAI